MRLFFGLALVSAVFALIASCSFPFCKDCKVSLNVNDANVTVNVCLEVVYPSGAVRPCQDADTADAGDDGDDTGDETPE